MKVLHYIENRDNKFSADAKFVQMFCEQMSPVVNSTVVTGKPSRRTFLRTLYTTNPDIVHIHACWSYNASKVERWSLSRGYTVVLSTHGGLMPNVIQTEFWKQKAPRIIAYQWNMVRHCSLLLASSSKELKELKNLGWRRRIALVRSPFVNDDISTTPELCCQDLIAVYQKLIDTKKRLYISAFEEQMFTLMNHASIMHSKGIETADSPELTAVLETSKPRQQLSAMEWNELLLCAKDRGILDEILEGAHLLGMTPPTADVVTPPRFVPKFSLKIRVDKTTDKKLKKSFPLMEESDRAFVTKVARLRDRIMKHRCESDKYCVWKEMNDIFAFLRTVDYDEPQIISAMKILGITDFFGRLEQILTETHLLTIGFMTIDPINDKMTDYIRKQIYLRP